MSADRLCGAGRNLGLVGFLFSSLAERFFYLAEFSGS